MEWKASYISSVVENSLLYYNWPSLADYHTNHSILPPPHLLEYISCSLSIAWLQLVIGFMFEAQHYKEKPGIIQMKHPGLRLRPYVTLRFVSVKLIALATRKPFTCHKIVLF